MPKAGVYMKITKITQRNFSAFEKILPPCRKYPPLRFFGCVAEDTAIGCAVVDMTADGCSLSWLWVAEEYRGQGVGAALLDAACRMAAEEPGGCLMVTYPADAPWASILEYMLLKRGGMVLVHTYSQYRFSREELLQAPFLAGAKLADHAGIVPFSRLSQMQMYELERESEQTRNYMISHADFEHIDKERSIALLHKGEIGGALLIRTDGAEDILVLELLYLEKSVAGAGLALLRQAAFAALQHPAGLRELRFLCTEDASDQMCRTLMGAQEFTPMKYCHGTLYLRGEGGEKNG